VRPQIILVGIEARVAEKKELLRNNDIIPGHNFPLKVTAWSGTIIQTERNSSLDVETMTWTDSTEKTTITVNKGLIAHTKHAVKQKKRREANEAS